MATITLGRTLDATVDSVTTLQGPIGGPPSPWVTKSVSGLVTEPYDYIDLSYTGANLTGVVYKLGGAAGTVVATLTLGYDGVNLVSVLRT